MFDNAGYGCGVNAKCFRQLSLSSATRSETPNVSHVLGGEDGVRAYPEGVRCVESFRLLERAKAVVAIEAVTPAVSSWVDVLSVDDTSAGVANGAVHELESVEVRGKKLRVESACAGTKRGALATRTFNGGGGLGDGGE